MSSVLERTLGALELLTVHPEGLPLRMIADKLKVPASAAHRLLGELMQRGYVRQLRDQGDYILTPKLVSMMIDYMGAAGIVDFAQPVLDRLAHLAGDFVRLAVVDGDRLTWVARAQGARRGLRYDPDNEATARLSCTASGYAWLMTMSDEDALRLVTAQGFGRPEEFGPSAPTTAKRVLQLLAETRRRGCAMTTDMFGAGLASMAVPVRRVGETPVGVLSIAGPSVRLTPPRMAALRAPLLEAALEIAAASATSPLFVARRLATEQDERAPAKPRRRDSTAKPLVGA
jgi:DNA-binding IclR family transcriptional regulator